VEQKLLCVFGPSKLKIYKYNPFRLICIRRRDAAAEQYNLAKEPLVSLTHPCAIDTAHKTHPRLSSGASAPLYGVKNPFASGRASTKFSDALHGRMNMDLVFKILGSRGYFCLKSSPSFVRCESSVFCSHSGAISMQCKLWKVVPQC
jgi:hypothetical protein